MLQGHSVHFSGTAIPRSEMRAFLYLLPEEAAAVSGSAVHGAAPSEEGWAGGGSLAAGAPQQPLREEAGLEASRVPPTLI